MSDNTNKIHRLMRVSAELAALGSFHDILQGHVWAAPPTALEVRAAKLVSDARTLLHEQMELDRKGVLPGG